MFWGVKIYLVIFILVLFWLHASNGEIWDQSTLLILHCHYIKCFVQQILKQCISLLSLKLNQVSSDCHSTEPKPSISKGLIYHYQLFWRTAEVTKEQIIESLTAWNVTFLIQVFFIYLLWGSGCVNIRCWSHITRICKIIELGEEWRLSTTFNRDYLW
jgi:hypothetical protein